MVKENMNIMLLNSVTNEPWLILNLAQGRGVSSLLSGWNLRVVPYEHFLGSFTQHQLCQLFLHTLALASL